MRNDMKKIIDINLYAYGNGSSNFNCEKGAVVLKNAIENAGFADQCHWNPILKVNNHHQQTAALPDITALSEKLARSTEQSILNHHFFITLGGDHTAAIGSWSGAAKATRALGLIWFDAHMDSHTFETTPSHNIHGMPLAILLGHGEKELTHILSNQPKLKPENVVLIGVRSFENGEAALLEKLGVKIFYMDDIKKCGLKKIIDDAINIVTKNTTAFGISIDLDGFDPADAPGICTAAPDGIRSGNFLSEFKAIAHHPKLIGADIVEFNPSADVNHKTEKLAVALCGEFFSRLQIK